MLAALLAVLSLGTGAAHASAGARPPIAVGAFIHDSFRRPELYDSYAHEVGRPAVILGSYKTWTIPLVDPEQLDAVWERGSVPMVTWEPWGSRGQVFTLRDIANGRYDSYIAKAAGAAALWGHPFIVRFAHEMNGAWYPWGRERHGDSPRLYVAAWRHVVSIFREYGATNVLWDWVPNQNRSGRFPFQAYYPGDRWVDWVGLDGFNWSLSQRWETFTEIFASSYNSLVRMTSKPVMIAEVGSWEQGGRKALWVRSTMVRELPRFSHVRAFVWWSAKNVRGDDLRFNSSPRALAALRSAMRSPAYDATRADFLTTPDSLKGLGIVSLPSHRTTAERVRLALKDNYVWLGVSLLALCLLALGVAVLRSRRRGGGPGALSHKVP
jgi:hypothetical protein